MVVDSARSGFGTALLVVGPPGAGRSSVLAEATAAADDVTILTAGGVPAETATPFSGLSHLLAPHLTGAGHPSLDRLPAPQAAAMRSALGLAEGHTPPLAVGTAVLTLLTEAAAIRPVLVVVDDLHLLDPDSTAALVYAARRLANRPVAALFAAEDPPAAHLVDAGLPVHTLGELDEEAAGELLAVHGWSPPPPVRRAAVEATGGNPLALIQLATTRTPTERLEDVAIQLTVPLHDRQRAAFLRQLAHLPPDTRELLVIAAAAGDAPAGSVNTAVCALGHTSDVMEPAERSGVVAVGPGRIAFRHPLLRAAIYQDAPHHQRIAAHRELADALAALDPDAAAWHRALATASPDEDLARTLEEIGLRRPTGIHELAALLAAARLSAAGGDRDRRTTHAALSAWGSGQPEIARDLRTRVPTDEPATAARLAWLHGLLEIAGSDPVTSFARLERLAGGLGPAAPEHAAMLRLLAVTAAYNAGELDAGRRAASAVAQAGGTTGRLGELFALALDGRLPPDGSEPPQLLADLPAEVHKRPGMADSVVMALGGLGPHPVLTREFGVSACAAQRDAGVFGTLPINLLWLADVHLQLGHCDDAADCAEEVLRLTRDTDQRSGAALALAHLARVAAIRGAHRRCRELAADALAIAVATRTRAAAAHATWAVALAALAEGDAHEACDRLMLLSEPGSPFFHELIARQTAPDLVEAAVRADQRELAERVTAAFGIWAGRSTLPWAHAHHDRCLALIAEDDGEAHRLFARSSEAAAAGNRPFDLARTALLRGEALRRDRRRVEARTPLRLAVELFDGQGAPRWAEIARAQLRGAGGLGTSPRDDRAVSTVLTAQELQVARLAASGLSNKEIGALLFVSPRTVAYHLYKIFPKLGVSTRSQLRTVSLDGAGGEDGAEDGQTENGHAVSGDRVDADGHREPPTVPV